MRYFPMKNVSPGMVLGQDLYDGQGRLLIAKHVIMSAEYIESLTRMGFSGIYVDDEFTDGIEIQEIISPEVRRETVKGIRDFFMESNYNESAAADEARLKKMVINVVEDILSNGDVMCNMVDLKDYDDYTYFHCVNVAVLSAMMGVQYGMNRQELTTLTTAALLHDIGKKFVSIDVLNAPRKLTKEEMQLMTEHPRFGFEFLRETYNFPSRVYLGVLEHHEWYNGEGYPLGKQGKEIAVEARIIKIADVYDAMTSKRPYHDPMQPSEIVEYIMGRSGMEFDPEMVGVFLNKIAVYPIGCEVELSNGQHGVVVENFRDFVLRPRVKIMETGESINLMSDESARSITITKLLI